MISSQTPENRAPCHRGPALERKTKFQVGEHFGRGTESYPSVPADRGGWCWSNEEEKDLQEKEMSGNDPRGWRPRGSQAPPPWTSRGARAGMVLRELSVVALALWDRWPGRLPPARTGARHPRPLRPALSSGSPGLQLAEERPRPLVWCSAGVGRWRSGC